MSDFDRAISGQRLRIPARAWNGMLDLIEKDKRNTSLGGVGGVQDIENRCIAWVRNSSGSDVLPNAVLAIGNPIIVPADNENEFRYAVSFDAAAPSSTTAGNFVVTIDSIANGKIGRAVFAGLAPVKIDITDTGAKRAIEVSGQTGYLRTSNEGGVPIVWRVGGTSGQEWGVVIVGDRGASTQSPSHIITASTSIAGSDPERWKYTIKRATTNATTGAVTAVSGAPSLVAYNDFEDPSAYAHGQSLTLASGATLVPDGPCEGPVEAWFSGVYDGSGNPIYRFDAPTPMAVDCP